MANSGENASRRIGIWLLICTGFIAAMVVIGGLTRLTGSGLSITEWDLVMGTVPPLNERQWDEVFHKYQQSPEFRQVNSGMSLSEFKSIFWWEYAHRLIGRTIGFVFFIPLCYFIIRRQVTGTRILELSLLFVLGGLQGLLGWYMVKSGLVQNPHVSHFRLTAHLTLAFLLFGATLWQALRFLDDGNDRDRAVIAGPENRWIFAASVGLLALIFFQVALGAMVAGLKAGYVFNTFPKMGEFWIPPGLGRNTLVNGVAIQFFHRVTAYLVVAAILWLWWKSRGMACDSRQRGAFNFLLIAVLVQFALGVFTLTLRVPVPLAALHQLGALVLFAGAVYLIHALRRQLNGSPRRQNLDSPARVRDGH